MNISPPEDKIKEATNIKRWLPYRRVYIIYYPKEDEFVIKTFYKKIYSQYNRNGYLVWEMVKGE